MAENTGLTTRAMHMIQVLPISEEVTSEQTLAAAQQDVAAAREKLEQAAKELPEAAELRAARARVAAMRQAHKANRERADRIAASRIVDGLRSAHEEVRPDLLMEVANQISDERQVTRLCIAMRDLAEQDRDPLLTLPVFRRLRDRAVNRGALDRLPINVLEPLNGFGEWLRQAMPFQRLMETDPDPGSPAWGTWAVTLPHTRWNPEQIGGGVYPVTRAFLKREGGDHHERTVVVRLHDGSLVSAPERVADPFIRGLTGGRAQPGRSVV